MRVRLSIKQRWPHYEAATAPTGLAPAKPKRETKTSITTTTDTKSPKPAPDLREHPTPIERLPPELYVLILSHLPNFCDLWSAISASPHLAAAYQAYRRFIKGCIVNSLLGREPLHAHGMIAVADLLRLEVYEQEAGGEFLLLGRSANHSLQEQITAFRSQSERELYIAEHRVRFRSQRPRPRLAQYNFIIPEENFTFVASIPDRLSRLVPATRHLSQSFYTTYAKADAAAASGANPSALYAHSANDSGRRRCHRALLNYEVYNSLFRCECGASHARHQKWMMHQRKLFLSTLPPPDAQDVTWAQACVHRAIRETYALRSQARQRVVSYDDRVMWPLSLSEAVLDFAASRDLHILRHLLLPYDHNDDETRYWPLQAALFTGLRSGFPDLLENQVFHRDDCGICFRWLDR